MRGPVAQRHVREVHRLRDEEGLPFLEIADRLSLGRSTVYEYYNDPDGVMAAARKAKVTGVCKRCGTVTTNSGMPPGDHCRDCWPVVQRERSRQWILDSFHEWNRLFGAPPSSYDWNPGLVRYKGFEGGMWRVARYESTGRPWPSPTLVQNIFGSWKKGVIAAGFEPITRRDSWLGYHGRQLRDEEEGRVA